MGVFTFVCRDPATTGRLSSSMASFRLQLALLSSSSASSFKSLSQPIHLAAFSLPSPSSLLHLAFFRMSATMHAKIHRQKLDKLNIIKICEENLIPMARRFSGILKDNFTGMPVDIKEAWKLKSAPSDPTRLPEGKTQTKYASVTLPSILPSIHNLGEIKESLPYSITATKMDFQLTSYFAMRLHSMTNPFLNLNLQADHSSLNHFERLMSVLTLNQ